MGQYHYVVNFDKQEFLNPHLLSVGLKLWEQLVERPSTPQALFILLACSNGRGGGDLLRVPDSDEQVIGRWAGDRVAVVGDYAEDADIEGGFLPHPLSQVYRLCCEGVYRDISALVRLVLAAEFGIEYYSEPCRIINSDGSLTEFESWSFRRAPKAAFSILSK